MKRLVLFFISFLVFLACSPEDGADGPQGPQGEQGVQGIAGEDGAPGETGAADVRYSDWFTLDFGENPINDTTAFDFIITDEFTQEVKDQGLILVYARRSTSVGLIYYQLPHTDYSRSQHYLFRLSENFEDLLIWVRSVDGSNIITPHLTEFRYIVIPGSIRLGGKTSGKKYAAMPYEEITSLFSIPE